MYKKCPGKDLELERLSVSLAAVNIRWWSTGFYMKQSRVKSWVTKLDYFPFFKDLLGGVLWIRSLVILLNINVNIQTSLPLGAHFSEENPVL